MIILDVIAVVMAHAIGAWVLTYVLHSTLLILLAQVMERFRTDPVLRALAWRTALLGPVLTASLHTALPFGSPFRLATEPAGAVLGPRPWLAWLIVAAWSALVTFRIVSFVRAGSRARAALGVRATAPERMVRRVRVRARAAGIRAPLVSTSQRIFSPAALSPAEICLPAGLFEQLPVAQQDALIAHELAHIARHDPLWCGAAAGIAAVCWFQPLNWHALRRLRRATEHATDARAVSTTHEPLALARALAALAPHALRGPRMHMAATGSPIVERIRRILELPAAPPRHMRVRAAALVTALLGVCLAGGPGVNFTARNAANSIPALTPSPAQPGPELVRIRQIERQVRDIQRTATRRILP